MIDLEKFVVNRKGKLTKKYLFLSFLSVIFIVFNMCWS